MNPPIYMLLSSLMFASMGASLKLVAAELDTLMLVFLRSFFGLLFLIPLLVYRPVSLKTNLPGWHLTRTLAGLAAMYLFFYAIGKISLAVAVLLSYTTPLFAPLIGRLWLGERVGIKLSMIVLAGFTGVSLILKPGSSLFSTDGLIALLSGLIAAFAAVTIRFMGRTEPAERIVWYYTLGCTVISMFPVLAFSTLPDLHSILWMVLAGLFATLGQLFLSQAYTRAAPAIVGPYVYFNVIMASFYGWLFWQEIPDALSLVGIFIVIVAGIVAYRLPVQQQRH